MIGHLVAEFWQEVEQHLVKKHRFTPLEAQEALQRYRERLGSHGVSNLIYHWEPLDIAAAIEGGLFKKPPPKRRPRKRRV